MSKRDLLALRNALGEDRPNAPEQLFLKLLVCGTLKNKNFRV
jgi:hypothetical protein